MKERLLDYCQRLNFREKILLFIATLLLGGFLGAKSAQGVLESFFDYDFASLNEQKRQAQANKALYIDTQRQDKELKRLDTLLSHFEGSEKAYLDELYALASEQNINFISIKNSEQKEAAAEKHSVFIEFQSGFDRCLAFLRAVQHSRLFFEFSRLKLAKNEDLKVLEVFLNLSFVAVE